MLPPVGSLPLQPPEAVHELVLVLDHVSVDDCPMLIEVGVAISVTVGPAVTVTLTPV
jgi:predicted metal-dependent TIM-barrel fold hydrolase